jgi:AcrR family transcriptional regulator
MIMGRRKPYHHKNLRESLLQAAIQLIAEVGPTAFTLREVARRAGVSHNAPYRHFRDREELLAAVAAQGFVELTGAMVAAAERRSAPLDKLKHAGLAYVSFALRRPEHFTVMFDVPISRPRESTACSTLLSLVKDCQKAGQLPPGDSLQAALVAWTRVHGIAKLATSGRLPIRSKTAILKFAERVIDQGSATRR